MATALHHIPRCKSPYFFHVFTSFLLIFAKPSELVPFLDGKQVPSWADPWERWAEGEQIPFVSASLRPVSLGKLPLVTPLGPLLREAVRVTPKSLILSRIVPLTPAGSRIPAEHEAALVGFGGICFGPAHVNCYLHVFPCQDFQMDFVDPFSPFRR